MWKFHNFSITQILREIIVGDYELLHFVKAKSDQNNHNTGHSDQNPPKTKIGFFDGTPSTNPN